MNASDQAAKGGSVRTSSKVLLVAAGYLAAFAFAGMGTGIYVAVTPGVDRQTYSGMSAFGDSMVFLAIFGLAALPATGAGLFFLRPYPAFWRAASMAALAIASSAILALLATLFPQAAEAVFGMWSALSPLRILLAPLCALAFVLGGLIAPNRASRIMLLGAAAVEAAVFVRVALMWARSLHN